MLQLLVRIVFHNLKWNNATYCLPQTISTEINQNTNKPEEQFLKRLAFKESITEHLAPS